MSDAPCRVLLGDIVLYNTSCPCGLQVNKGNRMNGVTRAAITVLAAILAAPATYAADLLEVYERAAQNDPLIREAEANRLAALEAKPRALSQLLPQLNAAGSIARTETDGGSTFPQRLATGDIVNVPSTQATDLDNTQYQFRLQQSVFHWDQWMTLKQGESHGARHEANYVVAQQDLLVRSAERYFDVLAGEDTLAAATSARDAISRQL